MYKIYTKILLATLLVIQIAHMVALPDHLNATMIGSVNATQLNRELRQYINEQIKQQPNFNKRQPLNYRLPTWDRLIHTVRDMVKHDSGIQTLP